MAVGIVPGIILGLREGIEAALIIGIILAYLTKIGQKALHRYVYIGTIVAIIGSLIAAGVFAVTVGTFQGTAEQLFEGFAALLAVIVLTSMILWMMKAAKDIRKHVEGRIDVLVDRRQTMGLASLAFIAVFREGVETVLFMAGLTGVSTPADASVGIGVGVLIAAVVGFGIFRVSWKVNLKRFFQVTGVFLIIVAAGLFQFAAHELQEAYGWGLDGRVYDTRAVLPDRLPTDRGPNGAEVVGALLRGIVGYNDDPTQLEIFAYGLYWVFTAIVYWGIRTGKIEVVTRPIRGLWAALKRPFARTPAT